jgi:hypothetical protein
MSEDEAGEFLTKRQLLLCTKEDGTPDVGKPDEVSRARVFTSIGTRPAVLETLGESTPEAVERTQRLEAEKLVITFLDPALDPAHFNKRLALVEAMLAGKGAFCVRPHLALAGHRETGAA